MPPRSGIIDHASLRVPWKYQSVAVVERVKEARFARIDFIRSQLNASVTMQRPRDELLFPLMMRRHHGCGHDAGARSPRRAGCAAVPAPSPRPAGHWHHGQLLGLVRHAPPPGPRAWHATEISRHSLGGARRACAGGDDAAALMRRADALGCSWGPASLHRNKPMHLTALRAAGDRRPFGGAALCGSERRVAVSRAGISFVACRNAPTLKRPSSAIWPLARAATSSPLPISASPLSGGVRRPRGMTLSPRWSCSKRSEPATPRSPSAEPRSWATSRSSA